MTQPAGVGAARLTVLLDLRHPLAYLALHPTIALAESLSLEVDWLPLSVPPLRAPRPPSAGDDRGARHRSFRAQSIAREISTYADSQGLEIREYYRSGSAEAANLAWLWMRDHRPERVAPLLCDMFRAYWSLELDPGSLEAVAEGVRSSGGDPGAFLDWAKREGPLAADALADELRSRGVFQVPAYLLDDEVFYGRAHLPMIRWLLEGRSGPIPI